MCILVVVEPPQEMLRGLVFGTRFELISLFDSVLVGLSAAGYNRLAKPSTTEDDHFFPKRKKQKKTKVKQ